ncbi:hypothetical protein OG625_27070 [Streptomyces sp. NBC_01351]|uniref:hypothetical protein n=1 Tax=Streptomyces sp. NBC_01351 TaxID=2903833 RepID=UPI002E318742|nr:hypothetical protein [Streptomyces sp. NBC_01351]
MAGNPRLGHAQSPEATRRAARGGTLIGLGWALRALGVVMAISGTPGRALFLVPTEGVAQLPWWLRVVIWLVILEAGWLVFDLGSRLLVQGKRHTATVITSFGQLAGVPYVLYLRPFVLDPVMASRTPEPGRLWRAPFELRGLTQEEFLVRRIGRLGRVVAIGRPGERLPLIGAERGYLPLDDWQDTVGELIRGAHVVMMSAAPGPGTLWEFTESVRTVPPARLVLLICTGPEVYEIFRYKAAQEYAARSGPGWPPMPHLPDWPTPGPQAKGRKWEYPLRGYITFDEAWRATFTPFEVTVRTLHWGWTTGREVTAQLEPLFGPLAELPPAH